MTYNRLLYLNSYALPRQYRFAFTNLQNQNKPKVCHNYCVHQGLSGFVTRHQRLLKLPDIFCKMLGPSDSENYRAKCFTATKEKLMFRGSCYNLCLWRLYKTMSFPTAKPFFMFYSVWFQKEKKPFLSLTISFRIRHLSKRSKLGIHTSMW